MTEAKTPRAKRLGRTPVDTEAPKAYLVRLDASVGTALDHLAREANTTVDGLIATSVAHFVATNTSASARDAVLDYVPAVRAVQQSDTYLAAMARLAGTPEKET